MFDYKILQEINHFIICYYLFVTNGLIIIYAISQHQMLNKLHC
jgi:hypothetical protein